MHRFNSHVCSYGLAQLTQSEQSYMAICICIAMEHVLLAVFVNSLLLSLLRVLFLHPLPLSPLMTIISGVPIFVACFVVCIHLSAFMYKYVYVRVYVFCVCINDYVCICMSMLLSLHMCTSVY